MPVKSSSVQPIRYPPETDSHEQAKLPSTRYFQIHFEYLENQLTETRRSIDAVQAQLANLSANLSLLLPQLTEPKDSK